MKRAIQPILLLFFLSNTFLLHSAENEKQALPLVKEIIVEGNKHIAKDEILKRLPYKEDQPFIEGKSSDAISRIYAIGHFRQIRIEKEMLPGNEIKLYVVVEERPLLEGVTFEGNRTIKTNKLKEDLEIEKLETIDDEQLQSLVQAIKKLYKAQDFHSTTIEYKLIIDKLAKDKASVVFTIAEGKKTRVTRVNFTGNEHLPDRTFRSAIFTSEDWLLSFLSDAGKYSEEAIEMDRQRIEYLYNEHGYLMAKVADVKVESFKDGTEIHITFDIKEGERFIVRDISVPGDDVYGEVELLPYVELVSGKPYSYSKMIKSIERLKAQWGELGYIYADVHPQVVPHEETKEVDITFHVEKGKKLFANRINITGNKVTKDRVIRREILLEEGDLITSKKMSQSRAAIEYLGFFGRGGVNWKMHPVSEDRADLELNVQEAKTGKANLALSYGSDKNSASRSVKISGSISKSNFLGRGWDVGVNLQSSLRRFRSGSIYFFDPHFF